MRSIVPTLALLAACLVVPALAQDESSSLEIPQTPDSTVPPELQGMLGDWLLEQDDPDLPTCPISLTDTQTTGGWAIAVNADCPAPYPTASTLTAWNVDVADGSVLLKDATGTVTIRLLEDEDGLYDSDPDVQPHFYLLPPYDEDDSGGEADD